MVTQEITVDAFQTLCAECADELASSNFVAASLKYAQATAVHLGLLNLHISTADESVTRMNSLKDLREAIEFAQKFGTDEDDGRFIKTKTGY